MAPPAIRASAIHAATPPRIRISTGPNAATLVSAGVPRAIVGLANLWLDKRFETWLNIPEISFSYI